MWNQLPRSIHKHQSPVYSLFYSRSHRCLRSTRKGNKILSLIIKKNVLFSRFEIVFAVSCFEIKLATQL
jgi:hypothetical protein